MKSISLLLSLGCLLSNAHAQTAPAKSKAAQPHDTVTAKGKATGRALKPKSKTTDMLMPVQAVKKQ